MAPDAALSTSQEPRLPALVSVDGRIYPLSSAHIRCRAEGGLAQSTLIQEFANPYEEPLEVLYTMPLPADGAVLGYTIRMGERVIRGEIEPRDQAEAIYKEALYSGRTAGLLEKEKLAVELPAGVSAAGVGLGYAGEIVMGLSETSHLMTLTRGSVLHPMDLAPEDRDWESMRKSGHPRPFAPVPSVPWKPDPGILFAQVIRVEGTDLILEIEVREDGFLLPRDEVNCFIRGLHRRQVAVVPEESSPAGPHIHGTRVRLVLRLEPGETWPSTAVSLFWESMLQPGGERSYRIVINPGRATRPGAGT